ncbi:MAG: DinB family protein [Candidatus Sulfotelmatobacter sp.]
MKRIPILVLALALTVVAIPLRGQDAMKKKDEAVKPPASPSQAVLEAWNEIGRKLIAMAEDFPEDKYDFKPNPAQRTFAEQLLHAANANYFFTNPAMGQKMPAEEDPKRDQYKTKADVVAFVKKAYADGAAAIKAKGDKGMSDLLVDPFAHQQVRISDMAYGFIEHSGEHYGQLVVYYRAAGLVPPESRPKK